MFKMMKQVGLTAALGVALTLSSAAFAHEESGKDAAADARGGTVHAGTVPGVISDSMCKFDHLAMIKSGSGKNAASCTKNCVAKGAKLVLANKKENKIYTFSNSKMAKAYAGKIVDVTGHIDPQTKVIHIHSIKAE